MNPNSAAARRKAHREESKSSKSNMSSMEAFDAAFELEEDLFQSENNPFVSQDTSKFLSLSSFIETI